KEGGGRSPRVSAALPGGSTRIVVPADGAWYSPTRVGSIGLTPSTGVTIAGIDVGEDYLDLALIEPGHAFSLARVALAGIEAERDPLAALAKRLGAALAACNWPIVALIDSPRWPSDCDCRISPMRFRAAHEGGRRIDVRLRAIVRSLAAISVSDSALRLSLFPTPRHDYFLRCIGDRACKPHLRAIGRQLFGADRPFPAEDGPRGGAIFTRFMLSGFAAYRALQVLGVATFEAYPDLQFRLWRESRPLTPKNRGRAAFADRSEIIAALAATLRLAEADRFGAQITTQITTMDQADAAILALSARAALDHGAILLIEEPDEGSFAIPMQMRQAGSLMDANSSHPLR
ncbi:MAG TPA: DUF429 domain-containing protein, partial [Candidatus Binataceae bacterium]|nr:DUF429 domain-containing protein [Candidatus Binataceae bacterium]